MRGRGWPGCRAGRGAPRLAGGLGGVPAAALTSPSAHSSFQQRLSYTTLSDLALALLDGTVFEIVQGLLEIQHLTEKSLYNQRLRLQNEHRGARGTWDTSAPSTLRLGGSNPFLAWLRGYSSNLTCSDFPVFPLIPLCYTDSKV